MRIEHEVDLTLDIDVRYDDGEPYGVIDAPEEVSRWIENQLGIAGMTAIDREIRARIEVERQNAAAKLAEARDEDAQYRAMAERVSR